MDFLVVKKGTLTVERNLFLTLVGAISCYICIIPFMLLDFFIWQFQHIYFRIFDIPFIERSDYIVLDRYKLGGLSIFQKINCVYCGYGNGLIAYAKSVVTQMEIYSCAIKHVRTPRGQDHHSTFYPRSKFE